MPPKNKNKTKTGMPIDPAGSIDLTGLAQQRLNFMDTYNQQLADINRNYNVQHRRAEQQEPWNIRGILNNYAARGAAAGSGQAVAQGRELQQYNQGQGDLNYQHTLGLENLHGQHTAFMRTYRNQQAAIRQAAADRLAAQAGSLGLYNRNKPLTAAQIARILAGNYSG
jgi:hypothetical protein